MMSLKLAKLSFTLLFFFSHSLWALSLTESFTSSTTYSSSTLVWNLAEQKLHPPLKVSNYNDGSFKNLNFDIGSGKHGVFNASTYSDWDQDGDLNDQVISINTQTYNELEFIRFDLEAGWTLRPLGDQPLVIKSQGTINIAGVIDCSGGDGQAITSDLTTAAAGGVGRCGGGHGGRGGIPTQAAENGSSGGASVSGGAAGSQQQAVDGGDGAGGGGAYSQNLTDAENGIRPPASVGGLKGTNFEDNAFQEIGGGSGGGGGFYYNGTDTALHSRGGGGGAGGGVVYIYSGGNIEFAATAAINTNGGKGGGGNFKAGAGGGGGGGSVLIFSGGEVRLNGAPIEALAGSGGESLGGDGGDGAVGRTWVTDAVGFDGPTGSGDDPISLLPAYGTVNYQTGSFEAESASIDSFNSFPKLLNIQTDGSIPTGDQLLFDLSSNKNPNFKANWIESSNLIGVTQERYFKYRVRVTSNDEANPTVINSISFNFDAYLLKDFEMTTGCGSLTKAHPLLFLFLFLPFIILVLMKLNFKT